MNNWPVESLQRFPKDLQIEILDELSPDDDVLEYINSWVLELQIPIFMSNDDLLKSNIVALERTPQNVLDIVNQKWGTCAKTKKVFDKKPERYFQYAKMNGDTAKPSVLVNGEIIFGNGRWIASLLRGDRGIFVWSIRTDAPPEL